MFLFIEKTPCSIILLLFYVHINFIFDSALVKHTVFEKALIINFRRKLLHAIVQLVVT